MHNLTELLFDFIPLYHSKVSSQLSWTSEDDLVNRSQEKALMITAKEGSVLPSSLGKCLDMKPGSLTTLMDGLVKRGLANRTPDPQDRRKQWITLTEQGTVHVEEKQNKIKEQLEKILSALPKEEQKLLETHIREASRIIDKL